MLRRVWDEIGKDNMSIIAAGCAFYALLALFPAITALVAVYGLVADPGDHRAADRCTRRRGPERGGRSVEDPGSRRRCAGSTKLGWGAAFALLLALYGATSGVKTLFEALNIAYEEEETRSFLRLNLTAFAFTRRRRRSASRS